MHCWLKTESDIEKGRQKLNSFSPHHPFFPGSTPLLWFLPLYLPPRAAGSELWDRHNQRTMISLMLLASLSFPLHQHGLSTGQSKSLTGHRGASPSLTLGYFASSVSHTFLHSSPPTHHFVLPHTGFPWGTTMVAVGAQPCPAVGQLELARTSCVLHGAAVTFTQGVCLQPSASTWASAPCTPLQNKI